MVAVFAFVLAIALALTIIYSGKYLITETVPLTGLSKIVAQLIIVILAIYPASFFFRGILEKLFPELYRD